MADKILNKETIFGLNNFPLTEKKLPKTYLEIRTEENSVSLFTNTPM